MAIHVSGFKFQGDSFQLPPGQASMTIDEIRQRYNLPNEGIVFLLNGTALGASDAGKTVVKDNDKLEVARAAKGGTR